LNLPTRKVVPRSAGFSGNGVSFRAKLSELRAECERQGRDPEQIEVSCSTNVLVLPDDAAARAQIEHVGAATGWPPERVQDQYVIGTPDEVARRLSLGCEWGVSHFICSVGGRPFTLWSDGMLELFASEVLPRVRRAASRPTA
jgi:alkanesulfonate monooxygenase SsuD/methylene tetrahydromethanopterin reductase-like flavin-dependent oxidoreductase (luciferase family)